LAIVILDEIVSKHWPKNRDGDQSEEQEEKKPAMPLMAEIDQAGTIVWRETPSSTQNSAKNSGWTHRRIDDQKKEKRCPFSLSPFVISLNELNI